MFLILKCVQVLYFMKGRYANLLVINSFHFINNFAGINAILGNPLVYRYVNRHCQKGNHLHLYSDMESFP